ncbi:MAG: Do family serine endopeptidase [Chthoniobacteraceae bacterium]
MRRFLFFLVIIGIFLAALYDWDHRRKEVAGHESYTPAKGSNLDANDVPLLSSIDREYTKLVNAVVPSVVSITTSKRVNAGYAIDPFELLLHHRLRGVPQEREGIALGSGVIVSKEGHILTNNHVIADMEKVEVELSDGRSVPAEIIGSDPETDIAVLKIKANDLNPLPIGDSEQVQVGQLAFAVGNPLGLQETVTRGIISAKSRVFDDSSMGFFQTDAAINEGNSGGPLVNIHGEIIGINTRIASQSGGSQGLGFAIPSNVARRVMESILKYGHVVHGYLGIAIQQLTPELAAQFGANAETGALVTGVAPESPAEKAGLKRGDIITKFNGHEVRSIQDLHGNVVETPVNTKVDITITRANQEMILNTVITEQPVQAQAQASPPVSPAVPAPPLQAAPSDTGDDSILSGIFVQEIPQPAREGLPENVKGVMVKEIDPDSVVAHSPDSLKPGDVIEEINHQPVLSVDDFEKISKELKNSDKQTLLFICRGKTRSFIVLPAR